MKEAEKKARALYDRRLKEDPTIGTIQLMVEFAQQQNEGKCINDNCNGNVSSKEDDILCDDCTINALKPQSSEVDKLQDIRESFERLESLEAKRDLLRNVKESTNQDKAQSSEVEERTDFPASAIPEFGTDEWLDCCEQLFGGMRNQKK